MPGWPSCGLPLRLLDGALVQDMVLFLLRQPTWPNTGPVAWKLLFQLFTNRAQQPGCILARSWGRVLWEAVSAARDENHWGQGGGG